MIFNHQSSIIHHQFRGLVLVLGFVSILNAAALYTAPAPTGDESGSGESNLMAWSVFCGSSRTGDTAYIRAMTSTISDSNWPTGVTYYTKYVKMYATYSVAWTLAEDCRCGQFANRDIWVVGPVDITGFTPASTLSAGRIKNGSQINPRATTTSQGYDNKAYNNPSYPYDMVYSPALNVAFDVNDSNSLTVPAGSSVVSSYSIAAYSRPQLQTAAVLTVLASAPAEGSFRPAFTGLDKTIRHNRSEINYNLLLSLAPVASTPTRSSIEAWFQRPWLDHIAGWSSGAIMPLSNMPYYGVDIANMTGIAGEMLHLNYTNAQKEKLLIGFLQVGLDEYGVLADGGKLEWEGQAGHGHGRKWPILFAGLLLNDSDLTGIGAKSGDYLADPLSPPADYLHFGEDDETHLVAAADVSRTNGQCLTGNSWTYRSTSARINGTIAGGHTIVQSTTLATGTVLAVFDQSNWAPNLDWVTIQWNGSGNDFDILGTHACTDQTDGGIFTPDWRGRWNLTGTWTPDTRDEMQLPYLDAHLGLAEWGIWHCFYPAKNNRWLGTEYRETVSPCFNGLVLPGLLMRQRALWNHPALFTYTDRWNDACLTGEPNAYITYTRSTHPFTRNMWDAYRTQYTGMALASAPTPVHQAVNVLETTDLEWTSPAGVTMRVFLGTNATAVANGTGGTDKGTVAKATYDTGTLSLNTQYFWRIQQTLDDGTDAGTLWQFTTRPYVPKYLLGRKD